MPIMRRCHACNCDAYWQTFSTLVADAADGAVADAAEPAICAAVGPAHAVVPMRESAEMVWRVSSAMLLWASKPVVGDRGAPAGRTTAYAITR